MTPGRSLLNKTVRRLRGPNIVPTLSFDIRPSSMPLRCNYEVDERRAVSVPHKEVSHAYSVSSHSSRPHPTLEADWSPSVVTTEFFSVSCLLPKSTLKASNDTKCWHVVRGPAEGHRAIPDNGQRDCASRNLSVFQTHAFIHSVVFGSSTQGSRVTGTFLP